MRYLLLIPGVLVLLVLIAVVRTLLSPKKTSDYRPQENEQEALRLAEKLSRMIQIDTTSHAGGDDPEKFRAFHKTLAELFPLVFSKLEKTEIDGNLLFYWKGRSSEKPILLMSHQDVVPAEGEWLHAPFSGDIADGKVWGRGASDTKCSVMAFFEAVEQLLAEDFTPPTDVYLASSCTEEWAGDGAPKLVKELQRRGVELFLLCDEGGGIISEPIGGIPGNFAMVGVFEKGKADVKFTAKSTGGHASAPGKHTPIARLAAFVNEAETHSPFKKKLLPEVAAMFRTLSGYASSFGLRLLLGNLWLFSPLLKAVLPAVSAQAGAMLKTTIAFTTQSGSDAYNVIPQEATLGAHMLDFCSIDHIQVFLSRILKAGIGCYYDWIIPRFAWEVKNLRKIRKLLEPYFPSEHLPLRFRRKRSYEKRKPRRLSLFMRDYFVPKMRSPASPRPGTM